MTGQHTPLPWRGYPKGSLGEGLIVTGLPGREDHGVEIADLLDENLRANGESANAFCLRGRQNAAFIVRACNTHYQMLEALRGIDTALTQAYGAFEAEGLREHIGEVAHDAWKDVRAAIAAAEAEDR